MKRKVLELRPTQMALGMKEVDVRSDKLRSMKHKELDEYLDQRRVPVVLGPRDRVYAVDHHHLVRACWETGLEELHVEVLADLSKRSFPEFWKCLHDSHWIFLYDQFGAGPHDPVDLPENIKGLADDPFRSLAWLVREKGGYRKSEIPFSEFQWANFFRKRLKLHPVFDHIEGALREALELAKTPEAARLPGRIPA